MKARSGSRRPPYGPNIVRAWFDTVFQYALQGLENERQCLVRRDWTFRCFKRDLEYLCPVTWLVPSGAQENLQQLVSFFPDIGEGIAEHDRWQLQEDADPLFLQNYFAEYLVNNVQVLPVYYATARSWNLFRDRLYPVLATPRVEPLYRATEESGRAMLGAVEALAATLRSIRADLSLHFDVPYVAELSTVR